ASIHSSRLAPTSTTTASINYQRAVGLLNYLVSCTRPDIAYTASCLAQFLNNPSREHEMVFKHVLQYLKGTKDWALSLGHSQDNSFIKAYCDADWGSNFDSRSFLGSCVFLYGVIGWKMSKQEVVALSLTEVEYRSISSFCQDVCWLFELVSDFGLTLRARLLCDNQGALALLKNPLYQHRTQQIKLRLHWCRELLNEGFLEVEYVPTGKMVADILTKSLCCQVHNKHCKTLGIVQGQY
ncbi:hypothetical protein O181_069090, partial [Austropuccinia psidii MF-1]|nr:hypothetical protein [Austropuccinia psidii MF-1]